MLSSSLFASRRPSPPTTTASTSRTLTARDRDLDRDRDPPSRTRRGRGRGRTSASSSSPYYRPSTARSRVSRVDEDLFLVTVPAEGLFRGETLFLGTFAVAWTTFTGVWTAGALIGGGPLFAAFSLPFWGAGVKLISDVVKKAFLQERLVIDFRLDYWALTTQWRVWLGSPPSRGNGAVGRGRGRDRRSDFDFDFDFDLDLDLDWSTTTGKEKVRSSKKEVITSGRASALRVDMSWVVRPARDEDDVETRMGSLTLLDDDMRTQWDAFGTAGLEERELRWLTQEIGAFLDDHEETHS